MDKAMPLSFSINYKHVLRIELGDFGHMERARRPEKLPTDVIWLNREFKVVGLKEDIKPFGLRIYLQSKASWVLELPSAG